jgi:hypothetical protein
MGLTYDLNNSDNWDLAYSETVTAQGVPGASDRYLPIQEIEVPILLYSQVIAVFCQSSQASPRWRLGGLMNLKIATGILTGSAVDTYPFEKKRIWLNQITLFTLPVLTPEYALSFDIPYWLRDIQISVFQYTGPIVDPLADKVDSIDANLTQLIADFQQHAGNIP